MRDVGALHHGNTYYYDHQPHHGIFSTTWLFEESSMSSNISTFASGRFGLGLVIAQND